MPEFNITRITNRLPLDTVSVSIPTESFGEIHPNETKLFSPSLPLKITSHLMELEDEDIYVFIGDSSGLIGGLTAVDGIGVINSLHTSPGDFDPENNQLLISLTAVPAGTNLHLIVIEGSSSPNSWVVGTIDEIGG